MLIIHIIIMLQVQPLEPVEQAGDEMITNQVNELNTLEFVLYQKAIACVQEVGYQPSCYHKDYPMAIVLYGMYEMVILNSSYPMVSKAKGFVDGWVIYVWDMDGKGYVCTSKPELMYR